MDTLFAGRARWHRPYKDGGAISGKSGGPECGTLQFLAVAQVAAVAETGHDVFVGVHAGVDGGAPEGGVLGHGLAHHVDALLGAYHAGDMQGGGSARLGQGLIAGGHGATRGQHGVGDDERLAPDAGRSHVLGVYAHLGMLAVGVHAEGGDEGVVGMVEHMEEPLMEGQSGPEDGAHDQVVGWHVDGSHAQGCGHLALLVVEGLGYLVGHHLADAADVVAEERPVLLVLGVADLRQVLVDDGVAVAQVDDFHDDTIIFGCKDNNFCNTQFAKTWTTMSFL